MNSLSAMSQRVADLQVAFWIMLNNWLASNPNTVALRKKVEKLLSVDDEIKE